MKKLINLVSLVVLVSVNVFTPFSYAQEGRLEVTDAWNTATLSPDTVWSKTISYNGQSYTIAWSDLDWYYYWWWDEPSYDNDMYSIEWNDDFWSNSTIWQEYNNAWWGGNDNESNHRWLDLNNATDRQWPCPDWWHVPSAWEREEVIIAWCHLSSNECQESDFMENRHDIISISKSWLGKSFMDDFWFNGNYRFSSTAYDSNSVMINDYYYNWARTLGFNTDSNIHVHTRPRFYSEKIRCMKNSVASVNPLTYTLTFDMDGGYGVANQTVEEDRIRSKPSNIPTKDGYIFKGWYTARDSNQLFDFSQNATEDKTIYAKWEYCGDGYKVLHNKCFLEDAWVYYEEWYIKVTDGINTKYIKDRNVWVSDSAVTFQKLWSVEGTWYDECDNSDDRGSCMMWKYLNGVVEINSTLETNYDNIYDAEIDITNYVLDEMEYNWDLTGQEMQKLRLSTVHDILDELCPYSYSGYDECYDNYMLDYINNVFNTGYNQIEDAWNYVYEYIWQENWYNMRDYSIINGYVWWNYYYRWNNNWVKYTDLAIDYNDNHKITNMETLEQRWFTWWRLWEPNTWWERYSEWENPCNGEWEYLPSWEDWLELMTLYWDINGYKMEDDSCNDPDNDCDYINYSYGFNNNGYQFSTEMLIPYWSIYDLNDNSATAFDTENMIWISLSWYVWYYNYGYLSYMTPENLRDNEWTHWWNRQAMPVRCFLDPEYVESTSGLPSYTVTYKDGDKTLFTKSVKKWKFAHNLKPWDKEWYIFGWWYTDQKLKNEFNFDEPITNNITLYAKWNEYGVFHRDGYIKITNGEDTVYIKDRNQWAENSISLIYNISDLINEYETCQLIAVPDEELASSLSTQDMSEVDEEFFAKVWALIWNNNLDSCEEIYEYIGDISPLTLWSYYFRWNNNWVNYTDLDIDYNNNWKIRNWASLDSEFLLWWRLWNDEWKWWIKWNINPCNGENEYLPTWKDWEQLIEIWRNVNEGGENNMQNDILIPSAWMINWESYGGDFVELRIAQDENWYVWDVFSENGLIDVEYFLIDDLWNNQYVNNEVAYPVRCFLNITESDDEEETLTPTTPTYTPTYEWSGKRRTWVTKTGKDKTHGSADDQKPQTEKEDTNEKQDTPKVPEVKPWENLVDNTPTTQLSNSHWSATTTNTTPAPTYTAEFKSAYSFAKTYWITSKETIQDAKMYTELTRIQMAKMLSQYAINVLGQTPDYSRWVVSFNDVSNKLNKEYDNAVTLAYQLGIMGQNMKNNNFRPKDTVTRAEFATALSRMLYWIEDGKWKTKYYEPHIAKLYNEWIINNTNAKMVEKRWYVMTMLMRTVR